MRYFPPPWLGPGDFSNPNGPQIDFDFSGRGVHLISNCHIQMIDPRGGEEAFGMAEQFGSSNAEPLRNGKMGYDSISISLQELKYGIRFHLLTTEIVVYSMQVG